MKVILTVIDVTGTQNYIFGSNRLRESIGASELVAKATSWWIFDKIKDWKTNIDTTKTYKNSASPFDAIQKISIEDNQLDAEVIYVGGGNALILFKVKGNDGKENARNFTKEYTRKLLNDAPNLDVVVSHSKEFEFENNCDILEIHKDVMKRITEKKTNRSLSSPLKGLAVSAQCVSTGGTASFDPKVLAIGSEKYETLLDKYGDNYVSAEVFEKLKMVDDANDRLERDLFEKTVLPEKVKAKLESETKYLVPPLGFDNLGRTEGDTSFIGVVHTDGNGIGNRIKEFGTIAQNNREWVDKMCAMSKSIEAANLHALQKMTDFLASKLELEEGKVILKADNGKSFRLKEGEIFSSGRWQKVIFYPFRPIIFGGEDVAFICDGRIALDLTVYYLKALQETNLADGRPLFGRAGVALVKSHYPFRRAYDLAEDLARSTKDRIDDIDKVGKEVYAIDWHLAFTGLAGSVKEIRNREYQDGKLSMRPLSIGRTKSNSDWFSWENFVSVTREFQDDWSEKRNKAKSLREVLRKRDEKVEHFLKLNQLELPEIKNCEAEMMQKGWFNERCGYFDALEMMDFYFPLESKSAQTDEQSEVKTDE